MLTDTGPLVALLDKDDSKYMACLAALGRLPRGPLRTTWPCFTEAIYMLHQPAGPLLRNQAAGWTGL